MCWKLIAIFNLLKIRMRVDIFGTEKCKVTLGLKYNLSASHPADKICCKLLLFCFCRFCCVFLRMRVRVCVCVRAFVCVNSRT